MRGYTTEVWVVMAAYQEERVIRTVVQDVIGAVGNVVVVDDGSQDMTAQEAEIAGAIVLRHPVNLGQGAALQTGIDYALTRGAKYIATFDADGQHQPKDIIRMLEAAEAHRVDVVLGSRFSGTAVGMPPARRILLRMAACFTRLVTGAKFSDPHNGLRLFTRYAAQSIRVQQNRMAHASEILEQIAKKRLSYIELGTTVYYTQYSKQKGQRASNAVNILLDLLLARLKR